MNNRQLASLFTAGLALVLFGCDGAGVSDLDGAAGRSMSAETAEAVEACATVGGYEVCLQSSAPDLTVGTTTFVYRVAPNGATEHLRHLVFGYEQGCTPEILVTSSDPAATNHEYSDDTQTGLFGVFYDSMQRKNQTLTYSITFDGAVPTGIAHVGVVIGGTPDFDPILGPACEPITFDVTGSVYVESDDATDDEYGTRESQESGMGNVKVWLTDVDGNLLSDGDGNAYESISNATGAFSFLSVEAGTYRVVVPPLSGCENAATSAFFNEILYCEEGGLPLYVFAYDPAADHGGVAAAEITLGPDKHIDLGFAPDSESIVAALGGSLQTKNELAFVDFLPLLAGLSTPEENRNATLFNHEIGNYNLSFIGRSFDGATEQTTYFYELKRRGGKGPDISNISFVTEGCMPSVVSPTNGLQIGTDPTTGLNTVRFDGSVRRSQVYALTYDNDPEPGVIDVSVKIGSDIVAVRMPGACTESIGSASSLFAALELIYDDGTTGDEYLFLDDPLKVGNHASELAAAIALMSIENPVEFGATDLSQRLLAAELVFLMGLGTDFPGFDQTLFQFVEPIIQLESLVQSAGKVGGIQAGTGGSKAGGTVLGGYLAY